MARNKQSRRYLPLIRAIAVVSAVGIVTAGVTFAALQSTGNALTGNTIETATASLQISKDGSTFSDSLPGYDFNSIIPGGAPQPASNGGYQVVLKNTGTTNLVLSLAVPTQPTVSGIADLSKVSVLVTPVISGSGTYSPITLKLSDLIAGKQPLAWGISHGLVTQNGTATFHVQVSMDADAVSGGGASISGLDLSFSGTPQ